MNISPQNYTGLEQLRRDVQKLKDEAEKLRRLAAQNKTAPTGGSVWQAVIPAVLGMIFALVVHFYYIPVLFYERVITSFVMALLAGGGVYLSLVLYNKMR